MDRKPLPQLKQLTRRLLRMASRVSTAVEQSIQALAEQDEQLADEVVAGDDAIDLAEVRIDQECCDLLSRPGGQSPDAVRYLVCILKINTDLERIADCAVNVAERLASFVRQEAPPLPAQLRIMANSAYGMLRDSMKAWAAQDIGLAREVMRADEHVDALYDQLARDLARRLSVGSRHGAYYLDYLMAARNFERIADHATNIAESVVHSATGRIVRHANARAPHPARA